MTLFGKILIGLILALSLVFASLSAAVYSAQYQYRDALDDAREQLAQQKSQAEDNETRMRGQISDLQADAARLKDNLDRETLARTKADQDIALLEQTLASTRTSLGVETSLAEITQDKFEAARSEALTGRERTAKLSDRYVTAEGEIAALTDENFSLQVSNEQRAQKNFRLLDENAALKAQLRDIGVAPNTAFSSEGPAPDVGGKVLYVEDGGSAGTKLAISLGSDDGLRAGDELEVVRMSGDGKYIGRIRITTTEPDLSIANLVFKSPTATIQKGDDVKTRL